MNSICPRCAERRGDFSDVCSACGHRPEDEGLLIAWLLSSEHLDDAGLDAAAVRIRDGQPIRPSGKMLEVARRALGRHFDTDPGMTRAHRVYLLACSLLLTPLVGWVLWFWWRADRPRAATQALALSAPASALLFVGVAYLALFG